MGEDLDVEGYIAYLHSSPPELLGDHLGELLERPEEALERLSVFVPEVCSMACARMAARDHATLERLSRALERGLGKLGPAGSVPKEVGLGLPRSTACALAYYAGRLQTVRVLAAQFPLMDIPPMTRAEALDGSDNEAVLFLLARRGPLSIRALRLALNGVVEGPVRSLEHVRKCLGRLIQLGAVETEHRASQVIYYRLSDLGRRLLEEQPAWMEVVQAAYRSHRQGAAPPPRPHADRLFQLFQIIDDEIAAEGDT